MEKFQIFTDKKNEGFALGGKANIVPQKYVDAYEAGELKKSYSEEYRRVEKRIDDNKLINMAPAHVRITEAGTLIIE